MTKEEFKMLTDKQADFIIYTACAISASLIFYIIFYIIIKGFELWG